MVCKPYVLNMATLFASTILDQVESTDPDTNISPIALPFVPLMQGGDDPGIIPRWLDLLVQKAHLDWQESYASAAVLFADLVARGPLWLPPLQEFNMRTSPILDSWRQEWRQEDRLEQCRTDVLTVLKARFNTIPENINQRISSQKSGQILHQWLVIASQCDSCPTFEQQTRL